MLSLISLFFLNALMTKCKSDIDCNDEFECSNNNDITTINQYITCNGYGSCFSSSISLIEDKNITYSSRSKYTTIECNGLRSCYNSSVFVINNPEQISSEEDTRPDIEAYGYLGLAFSNNILFEKYYAPTLECYGEASCYGIQSSSISYLGDILCSGVRSCSDVVSAGVNSLRGDGMFALLNSNFYSYNMNSDYGGTVNVRLYGYYSGFNASFGCLEGYKCNVDCGINGCDNFNYYCHDNAISCDVQCGDDVVCPNGWLSNGTYTSEFDNSYYTSNQFTFSYTNDLIDEMFSKVYSNDINHEEIECPNNAAIGDRLSCNLNNYDSCYYDGYLGEVNDSICINGAEILSNRDLDLIGTSNRLYCNGKESCVGSEIDLNDNNNIYCRGQESCQSSRIINGNDVIITGERGLQYGYIKSSKTVNCFGDEACYKADIINVESIYATGYNALYAANITSNGIDINIYLLGDDNGYLFTLTCTGTDTCKIYIIYPELEFLTHNVGCDSANLCTIEWILIDDTRFENDFADQTVVIEEPEQTETQEGTDQTQVVTEEDYYDDVDDVTELSIIDLHIDIKDIASVSTPATSGNNMYETNTYFSHDQESTESTDDGCIWMYNRLILILFTFANFMLL